MTRSSSLRLTSGLAIISGILQIIGCFLPFVIMKDGFDRVTLSTDSLWVYILYVIAMRGYTFSYILIPFICAFLLSMLIPLLTGFAGFVNRWRRGAITLSLLFAVFGLLEVCMYALLNFSFSGFCGPEAMSAADCTIVSAGPGLWLTSGGFLLSLGCFIVANTLYREPVPPVYRGSTPMY